MNSRGSLSFSSLVLAVAIFCCSNFTSSTSSLDEKSNLETLRLVQVLFRHGDRNPLKTFPTDSYKNTSMYSPQGLGQLTDTGKMQQYDLGRYLRRRYDKFISPSYVHGEIHVLSSDMDRTIMSAEANLAGFYQPINSTLNWNPKLPWTPVPFRTIPKYEDKFLQLEKPCNRFSKLKMEFQAGDAYQTFLKSIENITKKIAAESGITNASLTNIVDVYDTLLVQAKHNLTLPAWAEQKVLSDLNFVSGRYFTLNSYTPELARLRVGPLLKLMLENIDRSVSSNEGLMNSDEDEAMEKLVMYSAHDKTIAQLLTALGMYNMVTPPYAAALLMELHKDDKYDDYHLNMLYRNDTNHAPYLLEVPSCGNPCFLSKFRKLTEPIVPGNWEQECEDLNLQSRISALDSIYFNTLYYIIGVTAVCVVVTVWLVWSSGRAKDPPIFTKPHQIYASINSI